MILSIKNIHKSFGSLEILSGINLTIEEGDTIAIKGPSGSGKSTLLHIAGLMEKPSEGGIEVEGQSVGNMSESQLALTRLNTIGFLFQFHYLLPDFNLLENVLMPARLACDNLKKSEEKARLILDRLGLIHRIKHRPSQLSGGEQQRAALARALIRSPKILMCDEPTGNLDPHTADEVKSLIWSEVKTNNLTTLIVTHNDKLTENAKKVYQLDEKTLTSIPTAVS